jgi:hypothetical protein
VKLPVSSWTAAEAANLLLNYFCYMRFLRTLGFNQKQASAASRFLMPENMGNGRPLKPAQVGCLVFSEATRKAMRPSVGRFQAEWGLQCANQKGCVGVAGKIIGETGSD